MKKENKQYTVKVTYWINVYAKSPKEAEREVQNNFTEQIIEYVSIKALKKLKKSRFYNDKNIKEIPLLEFIKMKKEQKMKRGKKSE